MFGDWLETRYPNPVEGMTMLLLASRVRRCLAQLMDRRIARELGKKNYLERFGFLERRDETSFRAELSLVSRSEFET